MGETKITISGADKMKNKRLIAVIIGFIAAVYLIAWFIARAKIGYAVSLWSLLEGLTYLCIAIAGFLNNKFVLIGFPAIKLLLHIRSLILPILDGYYSSFIWYAIPVVAYVFLLISIIQWFDSKSKPLFNKLVWIIGLPFLLVCEINAVDNALSYLALYPENNDVVTLWIVEDIFDMLFYVLAGIWIYIDCRNDSKVDSGSKPVNTVNPITSGEMNNVSDAVVRLQNIKALLDNGIITQEEFDSKKAEILGSAADAKSKDDYSDNIDPAIAEKVRSLKELLDMGVMTQEDYDEKVRQITGTSREQLQDRINGLIQ